MRALCGLSRRLLFVAVALVVLGYAASPALAAPVLGYVVVARYPHLPSSYTEGFFYRDGLFYEGTGMEGHSGLLEVQPETGKVVRSVPLPPQFFGEGIIDWGPYLYQWTWKSHVCFVYNRDTLEPVKRFTYTGEGWGMTRTARQLITSDGSANLTFRDPETFQPVRSITVHDGPAVVDQLNELEYIKGEIYANIWHSDRIARIAPSDGHVIAWIDLSGILSPVLRTNVDDVLNGIAYDPKHDRLFVTGKHWPTVFEIRTVAKSAVPHAR